MKKTIKKFFAVVLLNISIWVMPQAIAHTLGQGYVFINIEEDSVHGKIQITLQDLDRVLPLDSDDDGLVSDEELTANIALVRQYLLENISVREPGGNNVLRLRDYELESIDVGRFLSIDYDSMPLTVTNDLIVSYGMVFEADPAHRGFLVLQSNAVTGEHYEGEGDELLIFTPGGQERILPAEGISAWASFADFLVHGIWHIWIGLDHILFLVALVLPSVLVRTTSQWQPVVEIKSTFWAVVKIVTLFTAAHTITLTLATLSIVEIPSRLVESVIAASVVFAALNNVYPILNRGMGYVVFAFGLFHGFGFASVLQDLIVSPRTMIVDLLGFNLGVEIGQLAIVAVVVPVLFALRRQRFYVPMVLKSGSALIGTLALFWLVERSLNLTLLA